MTIKVMIREVAEVTYLTLGSTHCGRDRDTVRAFDPDLCSRSRTANTVNTADHKM
jgi:hypothetical protein